MIEQDRICESINDGWQHVRDALNVVYMRIYQSDDADEKRELMKAAKALTEALLALGDARHRAQLQRDLTPRIVPYPYPGPYTSPWSPTIIFDGKAVTSGTVTSPKGRRVIVTNTTEA